MNQREAKALERALEELRRGPGAGWLEFIHGQAFPFGADSTPAEREKYLRLWLETWIAPPMSAAVERYGRTDR